MITVVDYGMGNVGSVINMIRRIGGDVRLSSSVTEVRSAQKIVLPGVGTFDAGMKALHERGLDDAIRDAATKNGALILGICLGMQLLLEESEEGNLTGLSIVPGQVRRFSTQEQGLRIPHMGWNVVRPVRSSVLFELSAEEQRFYFVHSYCVECLDPQDVVGVTYHGHNFSSALERGRVLGVQFHPEKSHRFGIALFQRFIKV